MMLIQCMMFSLLPVDFLHTNTKLQYLSQTGFNVKLQPYSTAMINFLWVYNLTHTISYLTHSCIHWGFDSSW